MVTKPLSIRFTEAVSNTIQGIANRQNKTVSDVIREQMERVVNKDFNFDAEVGQLISNPRESLMDMNGLLIQSKGVKSKDNEGEGAFAKSPYELNMTQIAALMVLWHQAYLHASPSVFVKPEYIFEFLDITKEMFEQVRIQNIDIDFNYYRSRLNIRDDQMSEADAIDKIKEKFPKISTSGWAENILRPIANWAYVLPKFSYASIRKIFNNERLEKLMPVAMKCIKKTNEYTIQRDIKSILPEYKDFKIGSSDLLFSLTAEPFGLIVSEGHHAYAFKNESTMSLLSIIETIDDYKNGNDFSFNFETLNLISVSGKVMIHENTGYRLILSLVEFNELKEKIVNLLQTEEGKQWKWLMNVFKQTNGDI